MIKAMLLTAQLALSPIVGTNGLQPKYLPNPVYGGEVDYSIQYDGKTWTRCGYINEDNYWYCDDPVAEESFKLYFTYKGIQCIGYAGFYSSFGSGEATKTIYFDGFMEEYPNIYATNGNLCVSWYGTTENGSLCYAEVFTEQREVYSSNVWQYTNSEWINTDLAFDDFIWIELQATTMAITEPCTLGNIPRYQPTRANPSVYDNIYNFFYQNLFANEALDELGAEVGSNSLTMRQWLAHTATIVSISLLACALIVLVIKIFKLIAGSISDIWG